jgi:Flp pilus assembly protein TadD
MRLRGLPLLALAVALSPGCGKPGKPSGPSHPPPVESSDVATRAQRPNGRSAPLIWIGLDGLDPDWMDRLASEGNLPNWSRLVSEGASAKLSSFLPILSPIVWTTQATGVGPDVHRVLDFQEVDPGSGAKVPISGRSRAVAAVWNVASASGLRVGVVGWWATHPAESVEGFFVSDRASPISFPAGPLSGVASPGALDATVAAIASRDGRIEPGDLSGYVGLPESEIAAGLASANGMKDPVFALGRVLASTRVYQRLARELYDRERPDFMTVYFEGTDAVGHVFAAFAPPRLPCVSERDAARFGNTAIAYYRAIDAILGQWMRRAREDGATLLVTSDHGFKWAADRPCERSSSDWSTAAFWHRPDGVIAAWGPRVARGTNASHPSVFDVAPTVLALLGLPADPKMPGRPIRSLFPDLPGLPARPELDMPVRRVAAMPVTAAQASEDAKKLVALGYISPRDAAAPALAPPGGSKPGMTEGAWNNLGLYERETAGDLPAAERDFRKALELRPEYHSPLFNLAVLYRREHKDGEALDFLFRSLAAGQADPSGTILTWAGEYRAEKLAGPELALLRRAAVVYPENEPIARALGDAFFRRHDCAASRTALSRFADGAADPETLNGLALSETCLGNRDRAVALFRRSLALKAEQPGVIEALRVLGR